MCCGRHLGEALAVTNEDPKALRRAKICRLLCTSARHISDEHAAEMARDRAASLIPGLHGEEAAKMDSLFIQLGMLRDALESARLSSQAPIAGGENARISEAFVSVYESCDDFAEHLKSLAERGRPTDSLWNTYHAGGGESAHFVQENYEYGVGYWCCPNPSPHSHAPHSVDGLYRRRPSISCSTLRRATDDTSTPPKLYADQQQRIGLILSIHASLRTVFDNPANVKSFPNLPNGKAFFEGRSPTILFRPQGAFGWFSYTTSRDTIVPCARDRLVRTPR